MSLPKYTDKKRKGNIGEALVQYLLSDFCLVHKIDGSSDVGNDFVCELVRGPYPTNLLFYVQVKYTRRKPSIRKETMEYWKTSPIPVFVFWIKDKDRPGRRMLATGEHFETIHKKYKRFTPILHNERKHRNEDYKEFSKIEFLRDLIIDYTRSQYKKGFTPIIRPRDFLTIEDKLDIGFSQHKLLIEDVIPEYEQEIINGGWANLLSLAIALEENHDFQYRRIALTLLRSAKELIVEDPRVQEYGVYIEAIDRRIINLTHDHE